MTDSNDKRVILIPAGKTDWSDQDRIQGDVNLPLSKEGATIVDAWVEQLACLEMGVIYSGKMDPCAETATRIGKALKLKVRRNDNLEEVHLGLWQGMQKADLQQKQPSVYKQWGDNPETVVPPRGESFVAARDRIEESLAEIVKRNKTRCFGVVLGHLSLALVRAQRDQGGIAGVWDVLKEELTWHEYVL